MQIKLLGGKLEKDLEFAIEGEETPHIRNTQS